MRTRTGEASDQKIIAQLRNKDGDDVKSADMSELLAFGQEFAMKLTTAMEAFSRTRALPTIGYAHQIQRWGMCIRETSTDISSFDLSEADDLDELHLIFLNWFFTENPATKSAKLENLKRYWTNMGDFISFCQRTKVVPVWEWFVLPQFGKNKAPKDFIQTRKDKVLGEKDPVPYADFYRKIIASKFLSITTYDHLEVLAADLEGNISLLTTTCIKEINKIRDCFEEGNRLSELADIDVLNSLKPGDPIENFFVPVQKPQHFPNQSLNENIPTNAKVTFHLKTIHIFSPSHKNGYINLLWWLKKHHDGIFPTGTDGRPTSPELHTIRKFNVTDLQEHLGIITYRKLIFFVALLMCKCREISNVSSLIKTTLDNITAANNQELRISTDKRRAHAIKSDLLDSEAKAAIEFLIQRTNKFREIYSLAHSQETKALFIGIKSDSLSGIPRLYRSESLTGKLFKAFINSQPELASLKSATLSAIRNTHAVIEYIRSDGSWPKVAVALGHKISTSMRHYVPPEITSILRERKARQHQNEMLLVASFEKDYDLLEALDFGSHEEVDSFLQNILRIKSNRTDILLQELDRKIACANDFKINAEAAEPSETEIAHIAISSQGLSALFRYEEFIDQHSEESRATILSSPSCYFWHSLSRDIKHLLGNDGYPNAEHRAIYKKAISLVPYLKGTTFSFSTESKQ